MIRDPKKIFFSFVRNGSHKLSVPLSRAGGKVRAVRGTALVVGKTRALGQLGLEEAERWGLGPPTGREEALLGHDRRLKPE